MLLQRENTKKFQFRYLSFKYTVKTVTRIPLVGSQVRDRKLNSIVSLHSMNFNYIALALRTYLAALSSFTTYYNRTKDHDLIYIMYKNVLFYVL